MSILYDALREGCGRCKYRWPDKREEYKDHGECRRFPPQVALTASPDGSSNYEQHWPWMHPDGWCGEFKRREPES